MNLKKTTTTVSALLLLSGCLYLSPSEKQQIEQLRQQGVDVDNPPKIPGTQKINPLPTALRSILAGKGDYELANADTEYPWFMVVGIANTITFPFSALWAPFQTYHDALTINHLRTLELHRRNPVHYAPQINYDSYETFAQPSAQVPYSNTYDNQASYDGYNQAPYVGYNSTAPAVTMRKPSATVTKSRVSETAQPSQRRMSHFFKNSQK